MHLILSSVSLHIHVYKTSKLHVARNTLLEVPRGLVTVRNTLLEEPRGLVKFERIRIQAYLPNDLFSAKSSVV